MSFNKNILVVSGVPAAMKQLSSESGMPGQTFLGLSIGFIHIFYEK
jgi:hypothetical protein